MVAIVAAFVVVKVLGGGTSGTGSSGPTGGALASIVRQTTQVPAGVFDTVGVPAGAAAPVALPGSTAPLTQGRLPKILYVGAEYCPFCASERWSVIVALSRFGTFSGLAASESASDDIHPRTKTFTFHGSSYRSAYVAFEGVETETNERDAATGRYAPLETLTAEQERILRQFDVAPYSSRSGAIPFLDIANRYVLAGSGYSPDLLAGLSWAQIAQRLRDPAHPIAQGIIGHANLLTAAICKVTDGQPGNVCSSSAVTQAMGRLSSS